MGNRIVHFLAFINDGLFTEEDRKNEDIGDGGFC